MDHAEWLPEKLTNKGLRVAADPPSAASGRKEHFRVPESSNGAGDEAAKPEPTPAPAPPPIEPVEPSEHIETGEPGGDGGRGIDELERRVGERISAIEDRVESRISSAVEGLRHVARRAPTPAPPPQRAQAPAPPVVSAPPPAPRPRRVSIESRLSEAEERVGRAVRATERNVDAVHRIIGSRLGNGNGAGNGSGPY